MEKHAPSIGITGGPCAGKTTYLSQVSDMLIDNGYTPLIVPEAATLMIDGNIKPWNTYLQKAIFETQMHFVKTFNKAAEHVTKPIILHDRGVLDNLAYMGEKEFRSLIAPNTLEHLRDSQFKAIIHLQTAAVDAEAFYTLSNNTARTETPEQARDIDMRLLHAWNGHPKHVTIANKGITFEKKMKMALDATLGILGIPVPIEDEQKFLIKNFFVEDFELNGIRAVATPIFQDYLVSPHGNTERVRMRGLPGSEIYFHTIKKAIPGSTANIEEEEVITKMHYRSLMKRKDPCRQTVTKIRYTFHANNLYFELDVFAGFLQGLFLLEVEKTIPDMEIRLPQFIERHIVAEVTGDPRYSNASLAKGMVPTY